MNNVPNGALSLNHAHLEAALCMALTHNAPHSISNILTFLNDKAF